jgi:hypothetical protein
MADTKLSAETELTQGNPAAGDLLYIVDVSDTTDGAGGSSRKVQATNLLSPAKFTAIANGSPADGDVWYGSTQKAVAAQVGGLTQRLVGCVYSMVADTTVANTTTETSLSTDTGAIGTRTLPANALVVGKKVRISAGGYYSGASGNGQVKLKLGSTALLLTAATALGTPTNRVWCLDADLVVKSVGASGTIEGSGFHSRSASASSTTVYEMNLPTPGTPVTIDTTSAQAVDITVTFSVAATGNTLTMNHFTIEFLD